MKKIVETRYCEICGASSEYKDIRYNKKFERLLCAKHYIQLKKYGTITDPTSIGCFDPNPYRIDGDVVYMDLFRRNGDIADIAIFDKELLDLFNGRRWQCVDKAHKHYVATIGKPGEGVAHQYMHILVMQYYGVHDPSLEVDHINGNSCDNRKVNLRMVTRQQQLQNRIAWVGKQIPIRGVTMDKSKQPVRYVAELKCNDIRYYLKPFDTLEEAVYARYILEKAVIGDINLIRAYDDMLPYIRKLTDEQRDTLKKYVLGRVHATNKKHGVRGDDAA